MFRRGLSLVEILVVAIILIALAAFLLPHYLGDSKTMAGKVVHSPKKRASGVECASNLRQIRMAYQMATMDGETKPGSLAELRTFGVSESIARCPVGGQYFLFNPANGMVRCPVPGHESH